MVLRSIRVLNWMATNTKDNKLTDGLHLIDSTESTDEPESDEVVQIFPNCVQSGHSWTDNVEPVTKHGGTSSRATTFHLGSVSGIVSAASKNEANQIAKTAIGL